MTTKTGITLAEAMKIAPKKLDKVLKCRTDLVTTDEEQADAVQRWLELTGVAGTDLEPLARREAENDPSLIVTFHMPMQNFLTWFRRTNWDHFAIGAETGTDDWGWEVLDRARATVANRTSLVLRTMMKPSSPNAAE